MKHLKQALRRSFRSPGFAIAVALLIATVVAVNATTFAALHALGWKALPYEQPDRLVELRTDMTKFGFQVGLSEALYERIRENPDTFTEAVGFVGTSARDRQGRDWHLTRITTDFTQVLGRMPALGRGFASAEGVGGSEGVIVLSDRVWRSRFGADPAIVGQTVELSGLVYSVIGVMAPDFAFPDAAPDAWVPYVASAAERAQEQRGSVGNFEVVARLSPTGTVSQARDVLDAAFASDDSLAQGRQLMGIQADARAWRERFSADHWRSLALLQFAGLMLLLVVTFNLAGLMIDRLLARQRELSIWRALGASEGDVMRNVVADLSLPVIAGSILGVLAIPVGVGILRGRGLLPADLPVEAGGDMATLLVAFAVAAAAIAVALGAALMMVVRQTRSGSDLREKVSVAGIGRTRATLLVSQIALSTVLVGCAGLLLRSATNLINEDKGFEAGGVLLTSVDVAGVTQGGMIDAATDPARHRALADRLRESVSMLPGVNHVALTSAAPFGGMEMVSSIRVPGASETIDVRSFAVSPDYFSVMKIPLLRGRGFADEDIGDASPVVVDEAFRQRWFSDVDPLTATIDLPGESADGGYRPARVVGVVPTLKHAALDEAPGLASVYRLDDMPGFFFLTTLAAQEPASIADSVRARVLQIAPDASVGINRPLEDAIAATLAGRRALLEAIGLFATLTLALAGLGLYAVLSVAVRRRIPELGVRMALGASSRRIVRLVMAQGGVLILVGLGVGVALGISVSTLLADRFYKLVSSDPPTWLITAIVIALVALLACWLPARRASSVPPSVALHAD